MTSGWSVGGLVRGAAIALVALGVGAGAAYAIAHEPAPAPDPGPPSAAALATAPRRAPPATAAELALVAPWKDGASLGVYTVARVEGTVDGTFRVVCKDGHRTVALIVALASEGGPPPPARTGRYAVYYVVRDASSDDAEKLAIELAKALEANADAEVPPGLGKFEASRSATETAL